jgi:hypothetical protein
MLLDQKVKVKWSKGNAKYYKEKGYLFTKYEDDFYVAIGDLSHSSRSFVQFICDYCGGDNQLDEKDKYKTYKDILNGRKNISKDCCSNIKCKTKKSNESRWNKSIPAGESLAEKFPELINEWSDKNEKSPWEHRPHSNKKVLWICSNNHEFSQSPNNRTSKKNKCPFCSGKQLTNSNNAAFLYPHLIEEFDSSKNNTEFSNIHPSSNKKVWWVCNKGHEYEAGVYKRTVRGDQCPYCRNKKTCLDNCLNTTHPKLATLWHPEKNELTPFDVTYKSGKRIWWKCKCGYEWKTSLNSFGGKCPECNLTKGEQKIKELLIKSGINYSIEYRYEDLRGIKGKYLRFDFAILNFERTPKLLIEYDGEFHFGKLYNGDDYENLRIHDIKKDDYCKTNKIPLIRIPFSEYENLETILANVFGYFNLNTENAREEFVIKYLVNHDSWDRDRYIAENKYKCTKFLEI